MGILFDKWEKASKERKLDEMQHFLYIQKGLKESMANISHSLNCFDNWDELLSLKEDESADEKKLKRTKTYKHKCDTFKFYFDLFGIIFTLFHLIWVQAFIIILNALFSEIVDEFKLLANSTSKDFNFYEKIQIKSYRELTEVDVVKITSSIGIVFLRNYGFYCSSITFQLISCVYVFLLFLLFVFHKAQHLSENYTVLELLVLILSYIFLSFTVGCISTLSLKEYFSIYSGVYFEIQ